MAQRVKVAEAAVEAARPAVDFVGALADSDGLWGLRAAGKALHQGPDGLIKWLMERGDLYDLDDGPVPKQRLMNRGQFTVVWREFGGKQRPTMKLTGRGIVHYAREFGVCPPGAPAQALLPGL
jgi:phage antirepressor YoqD-like protein